MTTLNPMNTRFLSRTAVLLFLVTATLLHGNDAEAQQQPDPLVVAAWSPTPIGLTVPQEASPSFERILVGSALGTAAGAAAGTGVAFLVYSTRTGDAYLGPLPDLLVIGAPITVLGTAVGTYIGTGGQVSPWIAGAASVVGVGLGLGAGILVGDALGPGSGEYVGGVVGAVIGITLPAMIVWAATR